MTMVMLANVAVAISSSGSIELSSSLTFFDRNFGYPHVVASASAVITTRDQQQQQQQQQQLSANNASNITSSNNSKSPTSSSSSTATTPPPPLDNIINNKDKPMPKLCENQPWLELCQPWFIPTITPTAYPTSMEPTTTEPTLFPSVDFTVEKEIVEISSTVQDMGGDENADDDNNNNNNSTTNVTNNNSTNASNNNNDASSPSSNNNGTTTTNNNNNITSNTLDTNSNNTTTAATTTNISITYKITPMDDTFLEVFRPDQVLGSKTKLKVDAEQEWDNVDDDTILRGEGGGAIPTKFVQLKFGLRQVLEEMSAMKKKNKKTFEAENAAVELSHAKLHLYALTSSSFGGYVTIVPSETKKKEEETAVSWNEELAVWSDYVKGGGGGGGRGGKKLLPNDKNPELSRIGQVLADQWYDVDVSDAILSMMKEEEVVNDDDDDDDDDDDGIGPEGNMDINNPLLSSKMKSLSLRISTNSTDGVIYASKEHPSGNGPYLELQFVVRNFTNATATATTINVTTASNSGTNNNSTSNSHKPSTSPTTTIPVMERPFKPGEENETDRTPIENSTVLEGESTLSSSTSNYFLFLSLTVCEYSYTLFYL